MPQTESGGTGTGSDPHDRLADRVAEWVRLDNLIKEMNQEPEALQDHQREALLREHRRNLSQQIAGIVRNHPNLYDPAVNLGFNPDLLKGNDVTDPSPGEETGGGGVGPDNNPSAGGTSNNQPSNNGGGGGNGGGGRGGGGGKGGRGEPVDHLPGVRGRDYHVVRGPHGAVLVVVDVPLHGGKHSNATFHVPDELLDHYGISKNEGKQLTQQQLKHLNFFGPITGIKLHRGEHLAASWMREMERKFGMAPGMLRNKEVMSTLFAAHLGKWDTAQLTGALEQTKWYQNRTDQRIKWLFETRKADRQTQLNSIGNDISSYVREQFGSVDWTKAGLTEDKIKQWAMNVASGKGTWDLSEVQSRIDNLARGIEGTNLWARENEASSQAKLQSQKWEDIFEDLRSRARTWLGPFSSPSKETLTKWAKQMANGDATDADFDQYVRGLKKSLYGYIDTDTTWQDFVDTYKNSAEKLFGAPVQYDDRLFMDLSAKTKDGGRDPKTAMSYTDFEQYIRHNDDRFWNGPVAAEESYDLTGFLEQMFRGVPNG